uniref:Uncharacterized protein n=1 Tax=Arundo donax TaxID=35708 RepID=A0A0A9GMX5_ARUDO
MLLSCTATLLSFHPAVFSLIPVLVMPGGSQKRASMLTFFDICYADSDYVVDWLLVSTFLLF